MADKKNIPGNNLRCYICKIETTDPRILEIHFQGKKHKKKLMEGENTNPSGNNFRCEICNLEATDENNLKMHFDGKKHQKNLALQDRVILN